MDDADKIVNKIFSWMDLQKDSIDKLNELATQLEEQQKTINVTKVVGSSVSVGGAAAMTVAGVVSVLTGGLSIPLLAGTGVVASGLGLATSVGSDVVGAVLSSRTMEEATNISKSLDALTAEITALMESLLTKTTGRQQRGKNVSPEEYVKEAILRAMAKRKGLILNEKESLIKLLSQLPLEKIFKNDVESDLLKKSTTEVPLLSDFVTGLVSEKLMKYRVSKASSLGLKASTTAVGKIGTGAVGLLFSVPELIENCKNLNSHETEDSRYLREKAGAIQEAYGAMKSELDEIEATCARLADTKWKKYRKRSSLCSCASSSP